MSRRAASPAPATSGRYRGPTQTRRHGAVCTRRTNGRAKRKPRPRSCQGGRGASRPPALQRSCRSESLTTLTADAASSSRLLAPNSAPSLDDEGHFQDIHALVCLEIEQEEGERGPEPQADVPIEPRRRVRRKARARVRSRGKADVPMEIVLACRVMRTPRMSSRTRFSAASPSQSRAVS